MLRVALLLPFLLLACLARPADAHIPPPVYMKLHVSDAETTVTVAAQIGLIRDWFGLEPRFLRRPGPLPDEHATVVEPKLLPWLEVRIDGREAEVAFDGGTLHHFEDHQMDWYYLELTLRVPTSQPPRQVEIVWQRYAKDTNYLFDEIALEVDGPGTSQDATLAPEAPSVVWKRPEGLAAEAPVVLPPPIEPATVVLPTVSAGLLLLALLGILCFGRRLGWSRSLALLAVGLLGAVLLGPFMQHEFDPPWIRPDARPPDDEALAIFAALHRSVYAAVELEEEEAVYDALERAVADELLETLYLDIRQSMVMNEQGGAVAEIRKTDLVSMELQPATAPDANWFIVQARWRVEGRVGHWGHTHHRINEYLGDVTVLAVDGRWKIARLETLDRQRVDDAEADR